MVLFGQKWLYSGKMVLIGQKLLYSGKSGCIRAKGVFYSGRSGSFRAKLVVFLSGCVRSEVGIFVKSGSIWAEVVLFGQMWL